jgi:hypothetical protein
VVSEHTPGKGEPEVALTRSEARAIYDVLRGDDYGDLAANPMTRLAYRSGETKLAVFLEGGQSPGPERRAEPMSDGATLYYLDVPVVPISTDAPNVKGRTAESFGPGHVSARWPDGKVYTHWYTQLWAKPFGRPR